MKLIIKSKQNYGTQIDEFTEEFQCSVEENEGILKVNFEKGFIKLEEKKLTYERNGNKIVIEAEKTTECDFETEYGMFVLDIKGIEFINYYTDNVLTESQKSLGLVVKARYEIQMVGVEPYENYIEIIIE